MVANDTTRGSTYLSVSGERSGDAANYCALDASLGLGRRTERKSENGGANDKSFHGFLPHEFPQIISEVKLGSVANRSACSRLSNRNIVFFRLLINSMALNGIRGCAQFLW